ncbi:uncharacterized protein CIMG_12652 [Coccidioides immitis RS]|uniref:Uncharacterized protein n=1 Tax=Coccidioides immitis (strain RS) TaxID=246410 RepID=A0A0D8JRR4_COCIM|nr:uncharacterized protein CIMG_12652 [Coccidioides immitis RS]KJF59982.1 hypothetical protein CIMG_12652 [Coccidioides immitis RS]
MNQQSNQSIHKDLKNSKEAYDPGWSQQLPSMKQSHSKDSSSTGKPIDRVTCQSKTNLPEKNLEDLLKDILHQILKKGQQKDNKSTRPNTVVGIPVSY